MTAAPKSDGVRPAPTIRVKQRDGVQLYSIGIRVKSERHRQRVQINIPVGQHDALGIAAGAASIEKLRQGIFIEFRDVSAVRRGDRQTVFIILRRKPARLRGGVEQEKSLKVANALAKGVHDFEEFFLKEEYFRSRIVQNVGQFLGCKPDV